jgi:uncharacterized FlaG/YvyC family protein
MTLYISSFSDKLNSPAHVELIKRTKNQYSHSELKTGPTKNVNRTIEKSNSLKIEVSDQISFSADHKVDYKVDQKTHEVVIRVLDRESGKVIRQIPGEEFLKLTQRIADFNEKHLDQIV